MSSDPGAKPKKRIAFQTITDKASGSTGFSSMDGRFGGNGGPSTSTSSAHVSGLAADRMPAMPGMGAPEKPAKKSAGDQLPCDNKTFRIELSLEQKNKDKNFFNQFNWLDLVAEKEDKLCQAKRKRLTSAAGPLDPFASDDDDQLKALAKKFESKYGEATTAKDKVKKKKKERKLDDYADLGFRRVKSSLLP